MTVSTLNDADPGFPEPLTADPTLLGEALQQLSRKYRMASHEIDHGRRPAGIDDSIWSWWKLAYSEYKRRRV